MFNRKSVGIAIIIVLCQSVFSMVDAQVVNIGILDKVQKKPDYQALANHLGHGGHKHDFVFYDSMDDLYRDFRLGELRLAMFGPVFYVKAEHEIGVIPLVKARPNSSVVFVRKNSDIKELGDLRGRRLILGYEKSTTSNLIPRLALWQNKIDKADVTGDRLVFEKNPQKIYFEYAGSHHAVIEAVLSGKFDAGASLDVFFESAKERGLRAIFTSEPYPGVPLVCHKEESQEFINTTRENFMSYSAPKESAYHIFKTGALAADNSDFDKIRYLSNIVLGTHYE